MGHRLPRKLAAILYADVAEYSRLTGEDEDATHLVLRAHLDFIASAIRDHSGRVVHYAGDAVLADFGTVLDALSCAMAIQEELEKRNAEYPDRRKVQFRIGVNLGDVIVDQDEIYGDGVNVAARLESLAEPGGICISEAVRVAVGNKLPLDYDDMGNQQVKNIERLVRAYRSRPRSADAASAKRAGPRAATGVDRRKRRTLVLAVVIAAVTIAAVLVTEITRKPEDPGPAAESGAALDSARSADSESREGPGEPMAPRDTEPSEEGPGQQAESGIENDAGVAVNTIANEQTGAAASERRFLSEAEIRKLLIGNTIDFLSPRNGMKMSVYFAPDGGVTVKAENNPNPVAIHNWFFKDGDIFCRTVLADRRNHCTRIMTGSSANTLDFINAKKGVLYTAEVLPGRQLAE